MLNIYASNVNGQLSETSEIVAGSWIKLINPTEKEIQCVTEKLNIPIDSIRDALDDEERSRIEKEDNHVLIIVDIPILKFDDHDFPIYETIPMGIIVMKEYFITVCLEDNPIFAEFTSQKVKSFFTYMKTRFTFQLLYVVATYYLRYLKQINRKTTLIEKELMHSMKNKEIFSLYTLEKSLVYFTTSLKANNVVMERMLRLNYLKMYEDDADLLEDVIIENKQAIEMTEIYTSILSGMMDTFSSVISNNVNMVMKLMTSVTILLAVPTMVSSFFGMNVPIPYQHKPLAFAFAIGLSVILSAFTAIIFWKKKYF